MAQTVEPLEDIEGASHRTLGAIVASKNCKHRIAHELIDDAASAEHTVGIQREQVVHDVLCATGLGRLRLTELREAPQVREEQRQVLACGRLIEALDQIFSQLP